MEDHGLAHRQPVRGKEIIPGSRLETLEDQLSGFGGQQSEVRARLFPSCVESTDKP